MKKVFAALILALVFLSCEHKEMCDTLFFNATIYTPGKDSMIADAMVIMDGKIKAIGKKGDLEKIYDAKEKIDLQNKPVYPGFIDAHCHFYYYG
ncbi:MAG: amidohydrolase, partial [Chitinophagales bacterium]